MAKKKTFEKKIIKENNSNLDDEPSWYHYVIILILITLFFTALYLLFGKNKTICEEINLKNETRYKCPVTIQKKTGSVEFFDTIEEIRKYNYLIEPSKQEVLNTKEFFLGFSEYNGTDNGQVALLSTRIVSLLKVFNFKFEENSFQKQIKLNCKNSTIEKKVILFSPYENENRITYNKSSGCIIFKSKNIKEFLKIGDKFLLNLVEE